MKTINIYERGDVVKFKRRGKELSGVISGKWDEGEDQGYCVEVADDFINVHAKNIIGLAKVSKKSK